jgi:hypothetical protein
VTKSIIAAGVFVIHWLVMVGGIALAQWLDVQRPALVALICVSLFEVVSLSCAVMEDEP